MRNRILTLCLILFVGIGTTWSQNKNITGEVFDRQGEPIIGASILVKGTKTGTISDINGKFTLQIPSKTPIIVSYLGHETQEYFPETGKQNRIILKEIDSALNEVVVIGFGTQKKVNLTGAVGAIGSKALEARPVQNAVQALQGLVGGLNITNESGGSLNSKPSINIRGIGTIGQGSNGSALVLVDGIETDLSTINPQDIASVSVLKDAAASSIYGSRAPFGVILVTTKRGRTGKMELNYNNNIRFSSPISMPKMADSYSFVQSMNAASHNAGWGDFFDQATVKRVKQYIDGEITTTTIPETGNPALWATGYFGGNDNINYYDEIYAKNVPSHEHNLSISGGNEKVTYYVSANYQRQSGLMNYGEDHSDRFTTNGRIQAKLLDNLDLQYGMRFTRNSYDQPSHMSGMFYEDLARQIWPTKPLYDNNGILYDDHILGLRDGGREKRQNNIFYQQAQITFEPLKGWRIVGNVDYKAGYEFQHWDYKSYTQTGVDGKTPGNEWYQSSVTEQVYNNHYYNVSLYSDYEKTFAQKHYFKAMAGIQTEGNNYRDLGARRDGLMDPNHPTLNTTTGLGKDGKAVSPSVNGAYTDWAVFGFFGRINYNYDEKYLFEANLRYDGSSRFRANNRWGLFPSFSAGWNMANESFFEPARNVVNTLKVRASYGSLGNQNTNNLYPTYEVMGIGRSSGNWLINGVRPNVAWFPALIDENLTWETIKTWNVGADWGLFNNRLTGSFDYFTRFTQDMVGPAPEVPATLGASVPPANNTDLKTWGFELELAWQDRLACGFGYKTRFVLSDARTKITRYPNPTNSLTMYREGQMMGEIWGYTTKGIAKTYDEMFEHTSSLSNGGQDMMGQNWDAGDIMYEDIDGNGRIDWGENTSTKPGDVKIIGNNTPRFNYGIDLSADYKGFDLRIFLQGVMKRDYFQGSYYFWGLNGSQGPWFSTLFDEHKDYFRNNPNDPLRMNTNSYYPRALFGTAKNQQVQTKYLQNAAYLRLKNVQLGYTFPQKWTKKAAIEKLRLYVSGENLLTFTQLSSIFDPETIGGGWGGSVYPLSKVFSFGLSVTF